jgi:hypothetical protein
MQCNFTIYTVVSRFIFRSDDFRRYDCTDGSRRRMGIKIWLSLQLPNLAQGYMYLFLNHTNVP